MTQETLINSVKKFQEECLRILTERNDKYSLSDDALNNIENGALVTKISVERALVHHLADKISRLGTLTAQWDSPEQWPIDTEAVLMAILDTLRDLSNYSAIYSAYLIPEEIIAEVTPDKSPATEPGLKGIIEPSVWGDLEGDPSPMPSTSPIQRLKDILKLK